MIYDITTANSFFKTTQELTNILSNDSIQVKGFHITTSSNRCKEILRRGIEPVGSVLANPDSELAQFLLYKHKLVFEMDKQEVIQSNDRIALEAYPYKTVSAILKRKVSAFLYCDNVNIYGEIHRYPEILNEMVKANILPQSLLSEWEKDRKAYKILFTVNAEQISRDFLNLHKSDIHTLLRNQLENKEKVDTTNGEVVFDSIPPYCIEKIIQL